MYKILVVDDEVVVRNGIEKCINWAKHGFVCCGYNSNGLQALATIERERPDVVLSDIRMPFMDGLQLMENINQNYPLTKVIFLTGHDEFEYAQQALRLKAYDFILKPFTANNLRNLLDKIKIEIDDEYRQREDLSQLQSQLMQSMPLLKERFLEHMVNSSLSEDEIQEKFAYFGLSLKSSVYVVTVFDFDDMEDQYPRKLEKEIALLHFAAFNIIDEIIAKENAIAFRTREGKMVAILSSYSQEQLDETAQTLCNEVCMSIQKYLKITVTAGIGRKVAALDSIHVSYKSANGVLDYRLLLGKNKILSITDLEGRSTPENFMNAEWGNTFSLRIKTGTLTEVNLFIEELIHHLKLSFHSMDASYFQIQKVILVLMNAVSELGEAEFQVLTNSRSVNMLNEVYRYQTLDDIEQWLKEICKKVLVYVSQKRKISTNQLMERATKYIQDNLAEQELSLQELSRYVHVSGNYLSTLFKQYTGDTFIEYLTRIRIEKAKEFMIQTDFKFYEIAPLVGCADPNYFSVVFKKNTGVTPKEYREKWIKGIT